MAGFHAMRAHDFEGAHELLCRCVDFVPARDLRLLAACGRRKPEPEALLAEAGWLEGHYGRPTARTRHAMAVAMLLLRRYDAAIGYCEDSLRLRPDRHGPWNNLGLAHLRSGDPEAAKRCYERAVELRPWFANSLGGLAQTRRLLGDFAGAEAAARRIEDECWREHELGNLAVGMAIAAAAGGDDAGRRAHAGVAAVRFRAAMAVPAEATRNPRQRSLPAALAYAEVLAGPEPAAATLGFLRQLQADPLNARQVANLAGLLRNHAVDDRCRAELCLLLLEIAAGLAPGDAQLRAGRDALRAEVEAKDR
ncbi:MAG: tetratricopeptide repeat protein [Planctomycetes bacterium]|nr:tetratricopeptide repeat protein [Planctomycetota bacterium]